MNKHSGFLCFLAVLASLVFTPLVLPAQTPQFYNSVAGTSYNAFPLNSTSSNQVQWCYGPGLFNSSGTTGTPAYMGNITTVYFRLGTTASGSATYTNFTISLGQNVGTIPTFNNGTFITGLTQCFYQASFTTTGAAPTSWYAVTLQTPFLYDPSQSLVFEMKVSAGTGNQVAQVSGSGNQRIWALYGSTSGSTGNGLVDFGFDLVPAGPCISPPTAGSTTINNNTPCLGQTIQLNLSGNSIGLGQTYEWESATNIAGPWTSLGAATSSSFTTTTASYIGTTYYRAAVVCGAQTSYSVIDSATVPTPFPGGTYTINSALPTGGGNFQTFAAAVSAIGCGITGPITFNVASGSGPYNEQINIPATVGSNSTNTVTFNCNGVTLTHAGTASNYATLNLDGADYFTFNNLNIVSTGATNGFALHMMNSADNNTFDSCTFTASTTGTGTTLGCVSMSGSTTVYSTAGSNGSNNSFTYCTTTGGYFGFAFYGNSPTGNANNSISNCLVREYYVYGTYCIQTNGTTVTNTTYERPTRATVSTGYGVILSTGCIGSLIENNRVRNLFGGAPTSTSAAYCFYSAATATAGNENRFYNNLASDIVSNGIIAGYYFTGGAYVKAYHNTASLDHTASASVDATYGIYATGTVSIDLKNNNISITRGGSGTKYCLYFTGAGKSSNHNNLYINAAAGTNYVGYYSTTAVGGTTLTAWQAVNSSAWDANSVAVDPIFSSPGTGNYSPGNSLMDDLGTPMGILTDINGASRSVTTPDIGAYEFAVPPCGGQPVAGTAVVGGNMTTACIGGPVSINLGGFTVASGISIQWEVSPAGAGVWTAIPGATASSMSTTFAGASDYRAMVTCVNGGGFDVSNTVTINQNPMYLCYCSPLTGNTIHSTTANYITAVWIPTTTLNSTTAVIGSGGYTQLNPSVPTNTAGLIQGQNYTLNASIASATYGTELWIDWDQSGTFDASEYALLTPGTTATATFQVPMTATTGLTGLRLRSYVTTAHGAAAACTSLSSGRETEDYVVNIIAPPPCSGVPTSPGTVSASLTQLCVSGNTNLSVTGFPAELGIQLQWEESPAGQNNFTAIPGATGITHAATGVTASTDYRMAVTCTTPGGGTAYTNTVSVTVNNPQLTSTTGGSRCGYGTVGLSATAPPGNAINWYAAASGGTPLATNTPGFTTPAIANTTTFYAEAVAGGGSVDSVAVPLANGNTTGVYFHMFMVNCTTSITISSIGIKCNNAVNTLTSWDVYYRSDNYQQIPGANTNAAGWTLLSTVTNVPSQGANAYTTIALGLSLSIPAGSTYSFHIAPVGAATHQYATNAAGTVTATNTTASIIAGHRGSLFNCTTAGGQAVVRISYTTGCAGTRSPVVATVTPAPAYTLTATPDSVCLGGSSTLTVSSANAYTYTWTPGGAGNTISVSPATTTKYYIAGADANNCNFLDSVTLVVKSVPATVSTIASTTTICGSGNVTLSLNPVPMSGIGIQWQSNTGSGFTDIAGANSNTYATPVTANISYQAKLLCNATQVGTSTPVAISYSNPVVLETFPGSRCNTGPVSLAATTTAPATLRWYTAPTGGSPVGTGGFYTTPSISGTTTYYVAAAAAGGSSGASPIQVTEINIGNDELEIQNVSGAAVNVTGWKVAVSNDYTNINAVNSIVQTLTGTMNPGDTKTWTDLAAGPNYWGNNILWNPGAYPTYTGWAAILDNNDNLMDIVFMNWPSANIQGASLVIGTATIAVGTQWSGNGINTATVAATDGVARQGTLDNNSASDFAIIPLSIGTTNPGMTLPFTGFGCEGARVPVTATINPSPSGTGLSSGGTSLDQNHADGTTVTYSDACNDMVATIADASGGNVLGNTSVTAITTPTVKTHQGQPFVPRFFDLSPASSGAATVTLYVLQSEFTAYNSYVTSNSLGLPLLPTGPADISGMNNIVITQFHGQPNAGTAGPLGLYSGANVSFIQNAAITKSSNGTYWTLTFAASGFSGFFVHTGGAITPLAIDLRSISATNAGSRNRVDWTTAAEAPDDRFEIERSVNGLLFTKIGSVSAKGQPSDYSFWDEHPVTGINYYRLRLTDASGKISYSRTVTASVKTGGFMVEAFPNPVRDILSVRILGRPDVNPAIRITDITGKAIWSVPVESDRMEIDMKGLAQGTYLVKYTDNSQSQTIKITKQ